MAKVVPRFCPMCGNTEGLKLFGKPGEYEEVQCQACDWAGSIHTFKEDEETAIMLGLELVD